MYHMLLSFLFQIFSSVYRQQLVVALMMHLSQQMSGINAVSVSCSSWLNFHKHRKINQICCVFLDLLLLHFHLWTSRRGPADLRHHRGRGDQHHLHYGVCECPKKEKKNTQECFPAHRWGVVFRWCWWTELAGGLWLWRVWEGCASVL